tara:strand:+ start:13137 stop:14180 length:1044 start_codon:yes stop_codon:yes gene_type:complete
MSKKALLVGINYLKSNKYRLSSPINDIYIVRDFLIHYCNFKRDDIIMLSDSPKIEEAGSFFNITKHLKSFDNLNKDDFLFIYFSGHKSRYFDNEKKDEIFLPQDWNINQLTSDYLKNYLLKYNCRTFVMFDCCNTKVDCDLKYNYNAKKMELIENLKLNDEKNDIILLTSGSVNTNSYEKFLESNLINSDKNKFYGELTIFFLQILKNYLEIKLSFTDLKYENLVDLINEYLFELEEKNNKTVNYVLKHNILKNTNIIPYISMSNKKSIKNKFLYNSKNDENEELEEQNTLNVLKRKTVTSLSYKYLRLKRKHDYILKINESLEERNNKLLTIISGNLQYNFGMVNR